MNAATRFELAVVVIAMALGLNATRNREGSSQEFESCWHPLEASDLTAYPLRGTLAEVRADARARESRVGPGVDVCMAAKSLYIVRDSRGDCADERLPDCYRRPWLDAAVK